MSTLDVQVQVPRVGREPHELAMLNVTLPANVAYHMVNMRTPASRLATVFDPSGALVTTDTYGVTLAAAVPGSSEAVRLRVVITNLQGRQSVRCEGAAGQAVRAVVKSHHLEWRASKQRGHKAGQSDARNFGESVPHDMCLVDSAGRDGHLRRRRVSRCGTQSALPGLVRLGDWVPHLDRQRGKCTLPRGIGQLIEMLTAEAVVAASLCDQGSCPAKIAARHGSGSPFQEVYLDVNYKVLKTIVLPLVAPGRCMTGCNQLAVGRSSSRAGR